MGVEYVAFLRAINVGRHNRIKMADLRTRCEAAGLRRVLTYVQTGNLVFEADMDTGEVVELLEAELVAMSCRNADAIVLTREELADVLAVRPFEEHDPERFRRVVTLLRSPMGEGVGAGLAGQAGVVAVHARAIFSVVEIGPGPTQDLNGLLQKTVKIPATTRYWHVVKEMASLGVAAGE